MATSAGSHLLSRLGYMTQAAVPTAPTGAPSTPATRIAYQGEPGSNSDAACRVVYSELEAVPCATFEDVFAVMAEGGADLAMIPVENSIAGRVADIHHLLPESDLHIIGEYFMPIHFQLMTVPGASLADISIVRSHAHALGQCRRLIREHGWRAIVADDTAGAAREVAEAGDPKVAALAPRLAADLYGLSILATDVEDEHNNTTRFLTRAPENRSCPRSWSSHHEFRLPGAQRASRSLQSNGRICHQRRQHDQAGKLSTRWEFLRDAVLCRCRRPSR